MKTVLASLAAVAMTFALSGCCCDKCQTCPSKSKDCTKCGTPECKCKAAAKCTKCGTPECTCQKK